MVVRDAPDTDTTDVPYFTSDLWTGELEGLWTENIADTEDTRTVDRQQPLRYEDALRRYLNGNAEPSLGADTAQTADLDVEPVKESKTAPKPKEQIISELAPKLRTTNMTTGRAMILAEQTYADAEKRFGPDAQAVLESYQPGQDPKRFLDGFQNAYLAGKMGNSTALNNSTAAAYLTQEQREFAYALGARRSY